MNAIKRQSVYWLMLVLFFANVSGLLLHVHCHEHECDGGHDSDNCPVCHILTDAGHKVVLSVAVQVAVCTIAVEQIEYVVSTPAQCQFATPDRQRAPPMVG